MKFLSKLLIHHFQDRSKGPMKVPFWRIFLQLCLKMHHHLMWMAKLDHLKCTNIYYLQPVNKFWFCEIKEILLIFWFCYFLILFDFFCIEDRNLLQQLCSHQLQIHMQALLKYLRKWMNICMFVINNLKSNLLCDKIIEKSICNHIMYGRMGDN